ncbi:MAG: hypothetical protein WCJ60_04545, partial [bacterium]
MSKTEAKNSTLSAYLTNLWSKYVKINVLFVVFVLLASLTGVFSYTRGRADAVTSSTLNFQARLLSSTGSTVADGTYNIEFNLYTVASGGTTQWTEDYLNTGTPITIKNGYLSANLGSLTAFPGTINWDQEQWLGMTVRGTGSCVFGSCTPTDSEMTPRFKLTAVPYALKSAVSANVSSSSTNSASVDSNAISVQSGNALGATSNSGNISIDSGTATGTTGTLLFGTTNASALTIGRAGVSTTLQGSVSLTGAGVGLAVTNNATIGGTLGVTSTSTFTGLLTANGGLTIATGYTLTNASSTLLTAQAISNLATGGNIGTAASTVDVATTFNVNQTTASQTITIPSPTVTTAGRIIYINNVGSASFIMGGITIAASTGSQAYIWNGSAWTTTTTNIGVTTIGTIDSQTKSANGAVISGTTLVLQNADATNVGLVSIGTQTFAGAKTFNTAATFSAAGTGLSVTNDATIGGTFAVTSTSTFTGLVTANGGITASGANSNINASSNFNTNINTGTSTGTTAIGNSLSTTTILGTTNINATGSANTTIGNGTGTFSLNTSAFDVSTAGALSGITSIGLSGAIAGATSVDTINGLIVNAGALSGITGFTQTSGNFSMSGTGTFGTGTGAISLNGDTTIASGKTLTVTGTGATILGGTLAVTGTQTFTGLGTFNGGLTIATGYTLTNASSTLLTAQAISNLATGGNIGTAASTVDVATTFNVNQTTASQTITIPSPTVTTAGRIIYINNVGSASFIMGGITIAASTGSQAYIWNGSAWTTTTTNIGVTTIGTIDSQTKSANGAVISGTTLVLQNADATNVGLVSIGTQTFAGDKTFTGTLLQKSNSTTAFRLQDSTGVYNNLTFDSNSNHLRVYNVAGTRLAYADIYYDDATSSAVFAASAGSTQIGAGTGNVDVTLVNNSEQFHFLHTGTNTPSADIDFYIGRNLSGTSNALNGAIVKIEDQSSFTSGSSAPDVLFINQGNSSATGNLIVAKTGGVTTKFAVTTDGNVTAAGTLVVTGNVTASANLTVGSGAGIGQFTNNGSTVNTTLVKTNFAAGGTIGTAATTVDIYTSISIAQSTASQTITLPIPTVSAAYGRVLYISNVGTVSFTILGSLILPGNTANLVWSNTSGAATWQYAGDGGGSGNYIQNQSTVDQTGDSRITGTARANTSVTTPLVDSISGALSIGTTTATGITVGGAATTGTIAIGNAAASTISIGAGAFAHTINVGTDLTTTQAVTVGSSSALSATAIQGGTGASAVSIQAASGGTISVGSAAASTVNVGTGAFAHTIAIGTDATTTQGITIGS